MLVGGVEVPRTHAEVAERLAHYAAGVLTGEVEEVVRRHLASGCGPCVAALFAHPLGLPREVAARRAAGGSWRVLAAVTVVIALMGTVLVTRIWLSPGADAAHVGPTAGARVRSLEIAARRSERRLAGLGARSRRLDRGLRDIPGGESITAASTRPGAVGSGPREPAPGAAERDFARLGTALAMPTTVIERLDTGPGAGGARGWVGWDPIGGRLFVYAVGLPRLRRAWHASVTSAAHVRHAPLRRLRDGGTWAVIEGEAAACRVDIAIVAPEGRPVLHRRQVGTCRARPAA